MKILDKDLVKRRFSSHLKQYDELSVVQRDICYHLYDKLETELAKFPPLEGVAYEIGAGTGFLTKFTLNGLPNLRWYINDLVPEAVDFIAPIADASLCPDFSYVWGDAEFLELEDDISLLVSSSAIQWFASIEDYIGRISAKIAKGGVVGFSIFGGSNFYQVRNASGIGLSYPTESEVCAWALESGFEVLYSEDYTQTIWFDTPKDVLTYIKESGMNGTSNGNWTRSDFRNFCDSYNNNYRDSKGVPLTFNPMVFILRKN